MNHRSVLASLTVTLVMLGMLGMTALAVPAYGQDDDSDWVAQRRAAIQAEMGNLQGQVDEVQRQINDLAALYTRGLAAAADSAKALTDAKAAEEGANAALDNAQKLMDTANHAWDAITKQFTEARENQPQARAARQAAAEAQNACDRAAAKVLPALAEAEPYQSTVAAITDAQAKLAALQAADDVEHDEVIAQAQALLDVQAEQQRLEQAALAADTDWARADARRQGAQAALTAAHAAFDAALKTDPQYLATQKARDDAVAGLKSATAAQATAKQKQAAALANSALISNQVAQVQRAGQQAEAARAGLYTRLTSLQSELRSLPQ